MKISIRLMAGALTMTGALLASTFALADVGFAEARQLRADGKILSEDRVVELAQKARPGEVTDLELDRDRGRLVYEVEVRDSAGVEWDLELDAATGEVLTNQQDD